MTTIGLTGIAALEAEMRDRLAEKNAEIERLSVKLDATLLDLSDSRRLSSRVQPYFAALNRIANYKNEDLKVADCEIIARNAIGYDDRDGGQ